MAVAFVSLFLIVTVAFLAPLVSWTIPRRLVPETVLLIVGGMIIGPGGLSLATATSSIDFLRELGMAFLFLMAGYEIDVNELRGAGGRHALVGWVGSLALAFGVVAAVGVSGGPTSANGIAIAIAMTSTAIGTILPILRERGLIHTQVGAAILNHGAIGEVSPIILMALLLGSRATWQSLLILLTFGAITVLIIRFTDRVKRIGRRLIEAIHLGGSTTAQTTIRLTVLLLVGLCTLAEMFELDVVLGAFAAGFILRYALPEGSHELEEKLDGLAYGFFVPIFFVTSGMAIQVSLSGDSLRLIGSFLVSLVVVRGLPVWVVSRLERRKDGSRVFSLRQATQIAVYSTTALPIIVAVTQVAVSSGAMSQSFASTLVVAGVVSVMVMPALGLVLGADADGASVAVGLPQSGTGHEGMLKVSAEQGGQSPASEVPTVPGAGSVNAGRDGVAGPIGAGTHSRGEGRPGERPTPTGSARGQKTVPAGESGALASPGERTQPSTSRLLAGADHLQRHGLTAAEAYYLAQRLAQLEEDRAHWRAQMRAQWRLDLEESQQRRALRRALIRQRRREDQAAARQLRKDIERARQTAARDRQSGAGQARGERGAGPRRARRGRR